MFELNNKVRLIDVSEYMITDADEFIGFICGIISQDHDLEQMYFDSFLKISSLEGEDILPTIKKLESIGEKFNVKFVLSISVDENDLPDELKSNVVVSL